MKHIKTTLSQLRKDAGTGQHLPQYLAARSSHKHLLGVPRVQSVDHVDEGAGVIVSSTETLLAFVIYFMNLNGWGKNITLLYKFRSRNVRNNFSKHNFIVHSITVRRTTMLGSSSEIIIISSTTLTNTNNKILFGGIMCLIVIGNIKMNPRLVYTTKRIVSGKDELMIINNIIPQSNLIRLSSALVVSLATVNVKNISKINVLQKLARQLLCQEDTGGTDKNGKGSARLVHTTNSIVNHDESLTRSSGSDDLPKLVLDHGGKALLLLGAEFHGKAVQYR